MDGLDQWLKGWMEWMDGCCQPLLCKQSSFPSGSESKLLVIKHMYSTSRMFNAYYALFSAIVIRNFV